MKYLFLIIVYFITHQIFAQSKTSDDTINTCGYLIIQTNIRNELSDIPFHYVFIPQKEIKDNFKEAFVSKSSPKNKNLFLIMPSISNINEITDLNATFAKFFPEENLQFSKDFLNKDDFFKKSNKLYQFKNFKNYNKAYKIIFINGEWLKTKVKRTSLLGVDETSLDPDAKEIDVYFLIKINMLDYEPLINDKSLIKFKNN